MITKEANRHPIHQKKYRKSQANKGLVRFELQVSQAAKARFDALVETAADEYPTPYSPRQRRAKARAQVFEEITHDVAHEFFTLKDHIEQLKAEIKALTPGFFALKEGTRPPLPKAIASLPDDPTQLKHLLAQQLKEKQTLAREQQRWKENANRYKDLYDAQSDYNEQLKAKLK